MYSGMGAFVVEVQFPDGHIQSGRVETLADVEAQRASLPEGYAILSVRTVDEAQAVTAVTEQAAAEQAIQTAQETGQTAQEVYSTILPMTIPEYGDAGMLFSSNRESSIVPWRESTAMILPAMPEPVPASFRQASLVPWVLGALGLYLISRRRTS